MLTITVDPATCKGDGLCARVCPARIFAAGADAKPPAVHHPEMCVLCGQCIAICPNGSIAHSRLDLTRFEKIAERTPVKADALVALLRQRRSVRVYKKETPPRELLEAIALTAGYAPTAAHGGEGWVRRVVVVTGEENMRTVRNLSIEYLRRLARLFENPFIRFLSHFKEQLRGGMAMLPDIHMRLAEHDKGHDVLSYDAPAAFFVHTPRVSPQPQVDCDTALLQIMLSAHTLGLGTCWNGFLSKAASGFKMKNFVALRRFLGIPDQHDVYAACTIGYPALRLHSMPQRETEIRWLT